MSTIVVVPQLGLSSDSVRLVAWHAREGDYVEAGAAIAEVETDKATYEVTAPASGHLYDLAAEAGAEIEAGAQLAVIGDKPSQPAPPPAESLPTARRVQEVSEHDSRVRAFPAARRRAETLGLDLTLIAGSGPRGTVTVADVERAATKAEPAHTGTERHRPSTLEAISMQSWQIPQFWVERTLELSRASQQLAERGAAPKPSALLDLVIAACGRALQAHPLFLPERERSSIMIAYLVATPGGLVAPTLQGVDVRGAATIGDDRRALVDRALNGRLTSDDVQPADFTISNLGAAGVDRFMALVAPGQRAILALGQIDSDMRVHAVVTADHRHLGGADVAGFLQTVTELLEDTASLNDLIEGRSQ